MMDQGIKDRQGEEEDRTNIMDSLKKEVVGSVDWRTQGVG